MDPHRQDLLESSFVTSLVLKLNPHQSFSIDSFRHDEHSLALLAVSARRINATVALLERNIIFNSKTIFSNNDDITDEVGYFMHVLYEVILNYVAVTQISQDDSNIGSAVELLSDRRCFQLVANLTRTYVQIFENWKDERYERLEPLCGKLVRILSSVSQGPVLDNISELMISYSCNGSTSSSSSSSQQGSANFAPLRVLKYLEFNFKGMLAILTLFGNIITEPRGGWKKAALLEISMPLKAFITSWMTRETCVLRDLYLGKSNSVLMSREDVASLSSVVGKILSVLEQWTSSGIRKRTVLWPTMCLLVRLVPDDLAKAVLIEDMTKSSLKGSSTVNVIARLLRAISKNFRPSKIASVLQTDAVTLSEVSVIFLVEYLQTSALIKSCNRGVAKYVPVSPQISLDGPSTTSMLRGSLGRSSDGGEDVYVTQYPAVPYGDARGSIRGTNEGVDVGVQRQRESSLSASFSMGKQYDFIERYFYPYDMFFLNHKERLEAMLITGLHPSLLYYTSLEQALESNGSAPLDPSDYTPTSLLTSFLWSLYFLEAGSFLKLCTSSLSQLAVQSTRLGTIEAIARVLGNSSQCRASAIELDIHSSPAVRKKKEVVREHGHRPISRPGGHGNAPQFCSSKCTKHHADSKVDISIIVNPFWSYGASCQVKSRVLGLIVSYARINIKLLPSETSLVKLVSQVLMSTSYHFNYDAEVGTSVDLASALLALRLVADNPTFVLVRHIDASRRGTIEEATVHPLFPTTFIAYFCLLLGEFCSLLKAKDACVSEAAASAIVSVIGTDTMRLWNTKGVFDGLLCVSSFMFVKLALLLGSFDSDNSAQTVRIFRILRHLLQTVNYFLVHAEDEATFQMADIVTGLVDFRSYAVNITESSIVLHLGSNDADISNLSAQCLGLLCINHDLIEGQDYSSGSWNIHRQISDPSMQLLMPADRQKTVRNLLGSTSAKSLGVRWALLVVRSRWEELSKIIKRCSSSDGDTFAIFTQFEEWSNYSSFLCALADGLGEASNPASTLAALLLKLSGTNAPGAVSDGGLESSSTTPPPCVGMPILSHADENSRLIRASFVTKNILEELLSLIVFNSSGSSDKKISQNAYLSIGMYLSDSFITPLFELLVKLLGVFDATLVKHRAHLDHVSSNGKATASGGSGGRFSKSFSSKESTKDISGSSGHGTSSPTSTGMGGIDLAACAEMNVSQIMSTMNSLLTMLEMIFERQWFNKVDFSSTNMEEMLLKLMMVVCKIQGLRPTISSASTSAAGSTLSSSLSLSEFTSGSNKDGGGSLSGLDSQGSRSYSIGGIESRERIQMALNPYNPLSPGALNSSSSSSSGSGASGSPSLTTHFSSSTGAHSLAHALSHAHIRNAASNSEKRSSYHSHNPDRRADAVKYRDREEHHVSLADELRLKKKAALMVQTYLKNRPNVYITNSFCMCAGATIMKWAYNCVNAHFTESSLINVSNNSSMKTSVRGGGLASGRANMGPAFNPRVATPIATLNISILISELEMYRATEIALMQTMVLLFEGIQIIPEEMESFPEEIASFITADSDYDEARGREEGLSGSNSTAASGSTARPNSVVSARNSGLEKRSEVFFKFFSIISTLLRSCDETTLTDICVNYASRSNANAYGSANAKALLTVANAHLDGNLTDACVDVLSNLFDANVTEGFAHITDSSTITCQSSGLQLAYMQVINRVLTRQGVLFGVKTIGDEDQVTHSYEDVLLILRQLIISPTDDTLRMTLCLSVQATKDAELLSANLLIVCAKKCAGAGDDLIVVRQLLEQLIPLEVASTVRLGSLFRNETICTKLMGLYFHAVGKEYLAAALMKPIRDLMMECPDLEIDPARMQMQEQSSSVSSGTNRNVQNNSAALEIWAEQFMTSLLGAVSILPNNIKVLLHIVSQESIKKFGQQKISVNGCDRISVGGYFFLRFVCPAIALPAKYGVLASSSQEPISKQNSRSLLLVVKVLQNLANGTQFTEEYMVGINHWIEEHDARFISFCAEISAPAESETAVVTDGVTGAAAHEEINCLSNSSSSSSCSVGGSADLGQVAAEGVDMSEPVEPVERVEEEVYDGLMKIHAYMFRQKAILLKLVEEGAQTVTAKSKDEGASLIETESSTGIPVALPAQGTGPNNPVNAPVAIGQLSKLPLVASLRVLLKHLGDPVEKSDDNKGSSKPPGFERKSNAVSDRIGPGYSHFPPECMTFLSATEAKPGFSARHAAMQQQRIFFCVGLPKEATFMFVLRRVEATTDMFLLLYCMVKAVHRALLAKVPAFDLVIDSTAFNFESALEPFTLKRWWEKCKKFLNKAMSHYLRRVYVLYPSKELADMSRRVLKVWGIKGQVAAQVTEVITPLALGHRLPHLMPTLAHSVAMKVEVGSEQQWPCTRHGKVVDVCFSNRMVLLESTDSFSGIKYKRTDMIPLHLIDSVVCGNIATELFNTLSETSVAGGGIKSNPARAAQQFADQQQQQASSSGGGLRAHASSLVSGLMSFDTVIVTLSWHARSFRLHSASAKGLEQAFLGALAQVRQQTAFEEVVKLAGAKSYVSVHAMPGTLLFVSVYNLFSTDEMARRAAYVMLGRIKDCFHLPLDMPLHTHDSVSLPMNPLPFVYSVCSQIAVARPDCVYEFLFGCVAAIKADTATVDHSRRMACIICMRPWLPALSNLIMTLQQHEETVAVTAADTKDATQPVNPARDASGNEISSASSTLTPMTISSAATASLPVTLSAAAQNSNSSSVPGTVGVTFGSRLFDSRLDDVVAHVVDMFDSLLEVHCDDNALRMVLSSEFWCDVGNDAKLTAYALKFFMAKWMLECTSPDTGSNSTNTSGGIGSGGSMNSNEDAVAQQIRLGGDRSNTVIDPLIASSNQSRFNTDGVAAAAGSKTDFGPRFQSSSLRTNKSPPLVSQQCFSMCTITAILAQTQPTLVSSLILNKVIRLINQPYQSLPAGGGTPSDHRNPYGQQSHSPGLAPGPDSVFADMEGGQELPKEYWQSIVALFRPMLFMPFQNHQLLAARIPDLFHMIVLLVARGPANLRAGVHGLTCSILHSLIAIVSNDPTALSRCVAGVGVGSGPGAEHGSKVSTVDHLSSPSRELCASPGLEPETMSPVGASVSSSTADVNISVLRTTLDLLCSPQFHHIFYESPSMTLNHLELLVRTLGEVVLSTTNSSLCEKWRKRWWKIAMATATDTLPSQASARCFVTLAILARPSDLVTKWTPLNAPIIMSTAPPVGSLVDDNAVFIKVFEALKVSLSAEGTVSADNYLLLYMLRASSKLVPFMKKGMLCSVFWISIACMHISTPKSFPEAIRLFTSILQELLTMYPDRLLEDVLLEHRRETPEIDALLIRFEETVGISFAAPRKKSDVDDASALEDSLCFSYAVTLTLLAGFNLPAIRDEIVVLLDRLARHYVRAMPEVGSSGLSGYAVVMFCFVTNRADMFPLHRRHYLQRDSEPAELERNASGAGTAVTRVSSLTRVPSLSNMVPALSSGTGSTGISAIMTAYHSGVSFSNANPHLVTPASAHTRSVMPSPPPSVKAEDSVAVQSAHVEADTPTVATTELRLYTPETFPNDQVAVLYVMTLLIALDKVEEDQGKVHACELLLEVLVCIPQAVVDMHDVVFAELMRMYHEIRGRRSSEAILSVIAEYFRLEDTINAKIPSGTGTGMTGSGGMKAGATRSSDVGTEAAAFGRSTVTMSMSAGIAEEGEGETESTVGPCADSDSELQEQFVSVAASADTTSVDSLLQRTLLPTSNIQFRPSDVDDQCNRTAEGSGSRSSDSASASVSSLNYRSSEFDAQIPTDYSCNILQDYMLPPPTPSKGAEADGLEAHRNLTINTTPVKAVKPVGRNSDAYGRLTPNSSTGVSGFAILKDMGFAEMLYVACFDKKPSCQPSNRVLISNVLVGLIDLFTAGLKQPEVAPTSDSGSAPVSSTPPRVPRTATDTAIQLVPMPLPDNKEELEQEDDLLNASNVSIAVPSRRFCNTPDTDDAGGVDNE